MFLLFILFSEIINCNSENIVIDIGLLIKKIETLERLENRVSESISDGKFFEHSELSLKWYDKFIYFYWNINYNRLYLRWDNNEFDVKNIIECGFINVCSNESSYIFNIKYMYTRDYIDFIINVKKLVDMRLDFLYKHLFIV